MLLATPMFGWVSTHNTTARVSGSDVGYSPAEVVVKEVKEETGIDAVPKRVIAVIDGVRQQFTRVPLYSLVFHCEAIGGGNCKVLVRSCRLRHLELQ